MSWLYLILVIVLEVCGTTLHETVGRIRKTNTLSFGALTLALKDIDVSIAYAVWSGL